MSEDVFIQIRTLLQKATPAEIERVRQATQASFRPIKITTDLTSLKKIPKLAAPSAVAFTKLSQKVDQTSGGLGKVEQGANKVTPAMKDMKKATDQSAQSFTSIIGKVALWTAVTTLVFAPIRAMREGIGTLREIDEQLTQLLKVTGETREVMNDFAFQANEIASRMGATTAAVIEQTTAWARLGYSIEEAGRLAENSILLSVVGNMDIDRATTALVSTLKAFNIEVENAVTVIDMVNEVGRNIAPYVSNNMREPRICGELLIA